MIDPFVILTPVLILVIVALAGFVGCLSKPAPPAPHLSATAGDQMVFLSWDPDIYGFWDGYTIKRGTTHGGPYSNVTTSLTADVITFTDTGLNDGTEYFYVMTGHVKGGGGGITFDPSESDNSNEVSAIPEPTITVTFDNPPPPGNPGDLLNGVYKSLNFGTGAWIWVDAALGMGPANSANINSGPNPGAADIGFANGPRILSRIRVFPKRVATVTITDNSTQNPQITVTYQTADLNAIHFIDTTWTLPTQSFNVAADIGFDLLVDIIIYQGPA